MRWSVQSVAVIHLNVGVVDEGAGYKRRCRNPAGAGKEVHGECRKLDYPRILRVAAAEAQCTFAKSTCVDLREVRVFVDQLAARREAVLGGLLGHVLTRNDV